MTEEDVKRIKELWALFVQSRIKHHNCETCGQPVYNDQFERQAEFNALVKKCCDSGHKFPDGKDACTAESTWTCQICGWDMYV